MCTPLTSGLNGSEKQLSLVSTHTEVMPLHNDGKRKQQNDVGRREETLQRTPN